jgi:hypothetical protein
MPEDMQIDENLNKTSINFQGRVDFDWDIGHGFLFAAGAQELYSQWLTTETRTIDIKGGDDFWLDLMGMLPNYSLNTKNHGLSTTVYALAEWMSPNQKFGAELGLRLDHFHFIGRDFSIATYPVVNPRLNIDYKVLQNVGIIDSLILTVGTGLFSSINNAIEEIDISNNIDDFELKPNRSWTSIIGGKLDFTGGYSATLEVYYKNVFDRGYRTVYTTGTQTIVDYYFDGVGQIFGFDLMLQKLGGRFWDGWLSYSFNYAQYKNPRVGDEWFFPSFHRFNYLNLVLNVKPTPSFSIGLRFGFATGTPETDDNTKRTGFVWPIDVKFSWHGFNRNGKAHREIYLAIENLQSLVYDAQVLSQGDDYDGNENVGEYKPVYDMPIPMISFGFKWNY